MYKVGGWATTTLGTSHLLGMGGLGRTGPLLCNNQAAKAFLYIILFFLIKFF